MRVLLTALLLPKAYLLEPLFILLCVHALAQRLVHSTAHATLGTVAVPMMGAHRTDCAAPLEAYLHSPPSLSIGKKVQIGIVSTCEVPGTTHGEMCACENGP